MNKRNSTTIAIIALLGIVLYMTIYTTKQPAEVSTYGVKPKKLLKVVAGSDIYFHRSPDSNSDSIRFVGLGRSQFMPMVEDGGNFNPVVVCAYDEQNGHYRVFDEIRNKRAFHPFDDDTQVWINKRFFSENIFKYGGQIDSSFSRDKLNRAIICAKTEEMFLIFIADNKEDADRINSRLKKPLPPVKLSFEGDECEGFGNVVFEDDTMPGAAKARDDTYMGGWELLAPISYVEKSYSSAQDRITAIEDSLQHRVVYIPSEQQEFCSIVEYYKDQFRSRARSELRLERASSLCNAINSKYFTKWVGSVKNKGVENGNAYIIFEMISYDFISFITTGYLTTNRALQDQIRHVEVGDMILASGRFQPSLVDCLEEGSMTTMGSMAYPEYVVEFTAVQKLGDSDFYKE